MTELLWAGDYDTARLILQRGIGFVYLIAFLCAFNQFPALLGERGLLPVPAYLRRTTFWRAPSIFHRHYSDRFLRLVAATGLVLSAGIVMGGLDYVPLWVTVAWWLTLWVLYLSVVNVGQTFYGFGWESLLLEAGFYAAFLGNATVATPWLVLLAFRWLLFRVEFGAGLIKLRGDPCWRNLTCLDYHHETQPMPGPTSRWFHLLPPWAHRIEVAANHVTQLAVPFLLFLPQPIAGVGAAAVIITQGYLILSGNYAWLNLLTLLLAASALPDGWLGNWAIVADRPGPAWLAVASMMLGVMVLWLSRHPVRNMAGKRQLMNFAFNRLHLVNTYGAFGSVTRRRRELILEGTLATHPNEEDWLPYEFKGKPGDPHRRPAQWAPYHLRLDWLMWFVPISPSYGSGWLDRLIASLLEADPAVLKLLRHDPFQSRPPRAIRGRIVDYRFTTHREKRRTGKWWETGPSTVLIPPRTRL